MPQYQRNGKSVSRRVLTVVGCVVVAVVASSTLAVWAEDASIIESRLQATVKFLSSDELEGRGPGTKGLEQAAQYLANEFSKLGLKTDLFNGSPFQTMEIVVDAKLGPPEHNQLTLLGPAVENGQPQRIEFNFGKDFNSLALGGTNKVKATVVFTGYGITAPEHKYDDYADVDVKGKVVLLLRKEPQQGNEKSVFGGTSATRHATFEAKVSNAYQHGAAAVILVNDAYSLDEEHKVRQKQWSETMDKLGEEHSTFRGNKEPSADDWNKHREAVAKLVERLTTLNQQLARGGDEVLAPDAAGYTTGARKMSVFFAKRELVDRMVKSTLSVDLAKLESKIDDGLKPKSQELKDWQADVESSIEHVKASVKNVIAVLEGSGSLADETVVVGAHYDHLGMGGREVGSLAPWTRDIHNGADDNASGAAALLEIARHLAATPQQPSRRIVFVAFTAEERGLLGSKHYIQNPRFPLEKTVAMVNLDMVGRLSEDKLIVYGTGTSASFDGLIEDLNKKYGFNLKKDPAGEGPSDHAVFYRKNIPVFHFFTGSHPDYHRPSDDVEKINVVGMRRVAGLVTEVVEHLAKVEERPNYIAVKSRAVIHSGERPRPSLGTMPDYAGNVEGCRLEFIRENGPADRAGIKAGDVIVKLGDNKVGSVEDYDAALRKFRPGDTIKVTVKRGDKTLELEATLGQPRG